MYFISRLCLISVCCISAVVARPAREVAVDKQFQEIKNGITVKIHEMSKDESRRCFGGHSFKNRKAPSSIIPLKMSVINDSTEDIKFSKKDIGLNLLNVDQLPKKIWQNKRALIIGLAASIFLWVGYAYFLFSLIGTEAALLISATPTVGGAAVVTTPAALGGAVEMFAGKTNWGEIKDEIIVHPGETKNVHLFVRKKDYRDAFSMHMHTSSNRVINFLISL